MAEPDGRGGPLPGRRQPALLITLYAIRNQSQPARTVADDKGTFEFVLPAGAELESVQAKGPGGQPIAERATSRVISTKPSPGVSTASDAVAIASARAR